MTRHFTRESCGTSNRKICTAIEFASGVVFLLFVCHFQKIKNVKPDWKCYKV